MPRSFHGAGLEKKTAPVSGASAGTSIAERSRHTLKPCLCWNRRAKVSIDDRNSVPQKILPGIRSEGVREQLVRSTSRNLSSREQKTIVLFPYMAGHRSPRCWCREAAWSRVTRAREVISSQVSPEAHRSSQLLNLYFFETDPDVSRYRSIRQASFEELLEFCERHLLPVR